MEVIQAQEQSHYSIGEKKECNMKLYVGRILTVDAKDSIADYLVENNGKILYVGNHLPKEYDKVDRVELGDKVMVPAFIDSHQHFASFATFHAGLNVMEAESNVEIMEMLETFVKESKNQTLIAFGASPYSVKEGSLLSREELDKVCPEKPIMMVKYDGHACIVNTVLLNKLRKKLENLRGYHPDTGEMNQEAFFAVSNYITNSISIPDLIKNMKNAVSHMTKNGIGMVHSVSGVGFILNADITLEQWFGKSLSNGFQLRVFPQSMNIKTATRRGIPRIGGCFVNALDGCFGSKDAALLEPYEGTKEDYGILYYDDEKVIDFCKKANRAGLQIEIHAIGDAAFDQAARAIKSALDDFPREDHRHGIIHDCMVTEEGLEICSKYHIQMPMQSAFIGWKQEPDEYLEEILGERAEHLNELRRIWDKGIVISAGSDAPCTDPNPISWMHRAVNHSTPEQSLTVKEALRMCTYNGAYATFDEKERGSLETGKMADFVLLSENPYEVEKEQIKEIKVMEVYLGGKKVK